MATWTLCTSGAAVIRAGVHANSALIVSGSALAGLYDAADGRIVAETRRSWSDNYALVASGCQNLLKDICSSIIAMDIIAYDNTGYIAREGDMLMNKLDERVNTGIATLKDFKSNQILSP